MPPTEPTDLPPTIANGGGQGNPIPQVTIRDWFAALAMAALVQADPKAKPAERAKAAYVQADAMLAERMKG